MWNDWAEQPELDTKEPVRSGGREPVPIGSSLAAIDLGDRVVPGIAGVKEPEQALEALARIWELGNLPDTLVAPRPGCER
jgi:hypothetical protein